MFSGPGQGLIEFMLMTFNVLHYGTEDLPVEQSQALPVFISG